MAERTREFHITVSVYQDTDKNTYEWECQFGSYETALTWFAEQVIDYDGRTLADELAVLLSSETGDTVTGDHVREALAKLSNE